MAATDTAVDVAGLPVVKVKAPVVAPSATVAVAGTVSAPVLLEVRFTVSPPGGAAHVIVTVPEPLELPPTRVVAVIAVGAFGVIVNERETRVTAGDGPTNVMVTKVSTGTWLVCTAKVAVLAP
jgi:hypothetical protein